MKHCWIALSGLLTVNAYADTLSTQVLTFFKQREPEYAQTLSVNVLKVSPPQPPCSQPLLRLPAQSRRWGILTLSAHCGQHVSVLRVEVKVCGQYYRSRTLVKQGELLTAHNVRPEFGRIDKLPAQAWLTPLPLPLVALRTISAGDILTEHQFRQPWVIKKGQYIPITLAGRGFQITTRGTALQNAGVNQSIRVRLDNGQPVTATVNANHEVIMK